jgi:hypothetical protein
VDKGQKGGSGDQESKRGKRVKESKARQREALHCAQIQQAKHKKLPRNVENTTRGGDNQAAPHAPRKEAPGRLRPMARVKNPVACEAIPAEEEPASTSSTAADNDPAQDVVRVSDIDGERNLSAPRGQQLAHVHPFRSGSLPGQLH